MTEEEKEAFELDFQNALDNIVSKIKGETATAIVHSEQSMIILFKRLIWEIERRQYKIQKQDTEINKLKKEKEYYKKLYNESYNFLDPKFTGDHIPRID